MTQVRFADFIAANMDELAALCRQQSVPDPVDGAAQSAADQSVASTMEILKAIVAFMRKLDVDAGKGEASDAVPRRVIVPDAVPGFTSAVGAGSALHIAGEFRTLRRAVLRAWLAAGYEPTPHEREDAARFHDAVDQMQALWLNAVDEGIHVACAALAEVLGHDVRTPLSTIANCAEVVVGAHPETQREAQMALRGVAQITLLCDNLLSFARLALGRTISFDFKPTRLQDIAVETVAGIRVLHPGREISLAVVGEPSGFWDPARLRQLLANLLARALRYGARDARIAVKVDGSAADGVSLSVQYSGAAIPAGQALALSAMSAGKPSRAGAVPAAHIPTDLYFSREVASRHGGTLEVVAEEGNATRFTLCIPRTPKTAH